MEITLKAFGGFQDILGKEQTIHIPDGCTMETLLAILCNRRLKLREALYDPAGVWKGSAVIVINGIDIRALRHWDSELREGDVVAFLLPMAGG